MLDGRNIKITRPNKSLDHKNMGPYKIIRAINNSAYELDLPSSMKNVFPVFHPWLLHRIIDDPLPSQKQPPPPPVHIDENGADHPAEEILDSKVDKRRKDPVTGDKGCLMYKIKYTEYDNDDDPPVWQVFTDAAGCPHLVTNFHHRYPNHPSPHSSFTTPEDWQPLLASLLLYCAYRTGGLDPLQPVKS